jgi:hypothetical protein
LSAEKGLGLTAKAKLSLEEYLEKVALFCENEYGNRFRTQFADMEGTSELAMLVAPTAAELAGLRKAVAIMTAAEKQTAVTLSDEQIRGIAEDARVDPANFAIFVNGYILTCKRVS